MIGKKHRASLRRTAGNSPPEPEPAAAVAAGSRGPRGISEAPTLSRRRLLEGGAALAGITLSGEARRALELFRRAAEEERLTVEVARAVIAYLYRARQDPRLRFEVSW